MRFFHISDLHFGKLLYGYDLTEEHRNFIEQLGNYCDKYNPDAVLIAGDVYDRSVPSADAMTLLDELLNKLSGRKVFIISGNHDNAKRLSFGKDFLKKHDIYISTVPPTGENEKIEKEKISEEILMEVKNITSEGKFKDISFNLRKGEVIAVTGLHGDGRDQLAEALYGVCKINSGEVWVNGKKLGYKSIKDSVENGISMVQRNRKERSIIKDMSILNNFSVSRFVSKHKKLFIDDKSEIERFDTRKKEMSTKIGHYDDYITSLSGGNQQKIIIGRCLELDTDVIILDNPTQGIDVGAKFEIYKIINELAKTGKGIIIFSSEYPEINKVADRCFVMYKGRINKELTRDEFSEINIMHYATGANMEEKI